VSRLDALRSTDAVIAAELRPPRAELDAAAGIDAWIDTYHAVRGLTRRGTFVFLTDSAVGTREEDTLRHLVANLGSDAPRERVVPFLTAKHTLEYCLGYADRAWEHGLTSLVVLGGDQTVGPPRCLPHGWALRKLIRARQPALQLGGWANPHADPAAQVGYLTDPNVTADFYLTQIVSHHQLRRVEAFLNEARRRGLRLAGIFGVFYYRSANPTTLGALSRLLPIPVDGVSREFAAGATADDVCARTIRSLRQLEIRHVYVSNLPVGSAHVVLPRILSKVGADRDRAALHRIQR
jgi:5,10-methylenetetrahydrofolate reductase